MEPTTTDKDTQKEDGTFPTTGKVCRLQAELAELPLLCAHRRGSALTSHRGQAD